MIRKRSTKLGLRTLLPVLSLLLLGAEARPHSFLRQLNGQNPHQACSAEDLTEFCPDDSVVQSKLIAKCKELHGIPAARCYMQYLCENHDQAAVNSHKECIDQECPLAHHIPPLSCADYLGVAEADDGEEANTENNDNSGEGNDASSGETENADVADEDILADLYGEEEVEEGEQESSANEEDGPKEVVSSEGEEEVGVFINDEEVEVEKPQQSEASTKEEEKEEAPPDESEKGPEFHVPEEDNNNDETDDGDGDEVYYYHPTTRIFICVAVPVILATIALIYRDRICGSRDAFPQDSPHISMENELQFNSNAEAT